MFSQWEGLSKEQREEFCKEYLVKQGYHVWGPITSKKEVTTIPQLVSFFYDRMAANRKDARIMYAVPNTKLDRGVLGNLVKSRMKLGMSKQRAIDETCFFIEQLFECEDRLLLEPVVSPRILANEKMAWLTERIWKICEGHDLETNIENEHKWFETTYAKQAEAQVESDVTEAIEKMNKILEGDK